MPQRPRISTAVAQTKKLFSLDPEGGIWVRVRPPGFAEEMERADLTSTRSQTLSPDMRPVIETHINPLALMLTEIWLTFDESNIDVDVQSRRDPQEYEQVNLALPRSKITRQEFMERLAALPQQVINEWRERVMEVVPAWRSPFGWTGSSPLESGMRP